MTHILVDGMLKLFFKWVYRLHIFTAEECKNHFKPTKINGNVKKKGYSFPYNCLSNQQGASGEGLKSCRSLTPGIAYANMTKSYSYKSYQL